MVEHALPAARRIADLKSEAKGRRIPVIYVNDNFGRWRSDFQATVRHCSQPHMPGRPIVDLLRPEDNDYFVLKPKHSGFFATTLETLLEYLGVRTVVLTGFAANICVLFTANDAYMRDLKLIVPVDCVASNTEAENRYAMEQIRDILKADIRPSTEIAWAEYTKR